MYLNGGTLHTPWLAATSPDGGSTITLDPLRRHHHRRHDSNATSSHAQLGYYQQCGRGRNQGAMFDTNGNSVGISVNLVNVRP